MIDKMKKKISNQQKHKKYFRLKISHKFQHIECIKYRIAISFTIHTYT